MIGTNIRSTYVYQKLKVTMRKIDNIGTNNSRSRPFIDHIHYIVELLCVRDCVRANDNNDNNNVEQHWNLLQHFQRNLFTFSPYSSK